MNTFIDIFKRRLSINSIFQSMFDSKRDLDIQVTDGTNPVTPEDVQLVGQTLTITVFDYISAIVELFEARVIADGGDFEAEQCLTNTLRNEFI